MNIEPYTLSYVSGDVLCDVWLLPSQADIEHKICVFLDGEFYLNRMDAPALICKMIARGDLAPMTCVFVSHINSEARHYDYTCNERYSDFISRDVFGWVRERVPTLSASGHSVCGLSLSGLASAFLAVTHPEVFSAAICQSASFWWNEEAFSRLAAETYADSSAYWISVGDKETETGISHPPSGLRQDISQIAACVKAADVLQARGNRVHYNEFNGGHEFGPWTNELPAALKWVMKIAT